jgi:hypothetical protein
MGTSKTSSDIDSVFKSILEQLEKVLNIDAKKDKEYRERKGFSDKLFYISENLLKQKLLILFDSIDQLVDSNFHLSWLFYHLPKNVKIIYSVLKDYKNLYDKLNKRFQKENIIEMRALTNAEAKNILFSFLKASNRRLAAKQEIIVNKLIESLEYICPLHVRLIFDVVSKWKSSYDEPADFMSCTTSIETIKYLFRIIEKKVINNEILFKHCLFYLTLFEYKGISENELEDMLSIDDEVLSSIYIFHHPPVRRFPMALWYRIKYELKEFLTNKLVDDVSVTAW